MPSARLLVLTSAAAVALAGCTDARVTEPLAAGARSSNQLLASQSSATSVEFRIIAPTDSLAVGDSVRLATIAISGRDTVRNSTYVSFTSTDPQVATAARGGTVRGVAAGRASVIASYVWRGRTNRDTVQFTVGGTSAVAAPDSSAPASTGDAGSGGATLPLTYLNTAMPVQTGRTLSVKAGGNLQAAIDSAKYGDVIALAPGATFTGNFILRAKSGTGWIVIRSAASDASLPAPGTRVTTTYKSRLATIATPNAMSALRTTSGAHHYRLVGLEITATSTVTSNGGLLLFGSGNSDQNDPARVPSWLVLDRSWVHGNDRLQLKRCVTLNSASSAVIDSRLEWCHGRGQDTQAILGYNGPGPFKIVNNYLADAAEVIMFGGATSTIKNVIPSDIEIRRNHVQQTPIMRNWLVKNLIELKTAQRVLIAENVIEHVWPDGQAGYAFNLKSSGFCGWCITRHVTIRSNYIADAAGGVSMIGRDTRKEDEPTNHIVIADNLFENIAQRLFTMIGGGGSVSDVTVDRNTGGAGSTLLVLESLPTLNLRMRNNAFFAGYYGIKGSGKTSGTPSLDGYAPKYVFTGNGIAGARAGTYPAGTVYATELAGIPTVAGDGTRRGADRAAIAALAAAVRGN